MDAEISEGLFKSYLDSLELRQEQHVCVNGDKNVDFRIVGETSVLCDVKEIRPSPTNPDQIDAYSHIREDLRELRKKFGSSKPTIPVLLITMNFSGRLFTGFSVARAMLGDIGAEISSVGRGDIHHLPRGNAVMTRSHTTLISGIFVFDCIAEGNHVIFPNPYAANPLPDGCFPFVRRVCVAKDATEEDLKALANITFWQCDTNHLPRRRYHNQHGEGPGMKQGSYRAGHVDAGASVVPCKDQRARASGCERCPDPN